MKSKLCQKCVKMQTMSAANLQQVKLALYSNSYSYGKSHFEVFIQGPQI